MQYICGTESLSVSVRARVLGLPNNSKTVEDRGSVPMGHQ